MRCHYSHVRDKDTEAQKGQTFLTWPLGWELVEPGFCWAARVLSVAAFCCQWEWDGALLQRSFSQ